MTTLLPIRYLTAGLFLLAACDGSAAPTSTPTTTTSPAVTTTAIATTTTTISTTTTRLERPFHFRSCASRIGEGYGPPDAELAIFDVGPVSFLALDVQETASMAASTFEPDSDGRYRALKYVTVVDGSAFGPVDLWVDPSNRSAAGLVYDPSLWDEGTLAAADHTVRFEGCPDRDAQFNGGFVITEPMCLYTTVIEWGSYPPLVSFGAIPFGVPSESCTPPDDG